ncbi:TRAP transporter small permease [Oceanobacillus piezotolerans]|uniref:TRAP transporter small permease n=1 Tax=Oceanobacillus piezotolerans TaxID=2448030 RepID=A0A498DEK9_9BACI|nr:TRAP transporter small permease [Oceanobacillus piezotolerans]RLL47090.1 TRAP transporter small permease [Oceanobacillus piezotolerans]
MIDKIKTILNWTILFIASVLLAALVLGALWQVSSRYVLGSPSTYTNELLGYLLVWTSMLGASYAFGSNEHLALTFMTNKLQGKNLFVVTVVNDLFILAFAVFVLLRGGLEAVTLTMSQTTPILGISIGLLYSILPISGFIIIIYKLLNLKDYKKLAEKAGD